MNIITENVTKVLGEDVENYLREMEIGFSCIDEMYESFLDGDIEDVMLCMKDLQDAMHSLQKMLAKKERRDKLVALVDGFKSRGIQVDFVSRLINEEAASAGTLTAMSK
ncbi:hypothetical protein ACNQFZ_06705 [Schinkia sp. CFF1]